MLAPARERHDPHKPPRRRITFLCHVRFQKLVSDERTRICIRSAFLELATGATGETGETGETEVVSKTPPQTPPPTHAGGQDDGS